MEGVVLVEVVVGYVEVVEWLGKPLGVGGVVVLLVACIVDVMLRYCGVRCASKLSHTR